MKIGNIFKVILVLAALSLASCEEDGPSLLGGGASSGTWSLHFSRQDSGNNGIEISAQCVSSSDSINIVPASNANQSLTCSSGDTIKIDMNVSVQGDNIRRFELNGSPVTGWDSWDRQGDPLPTPLIIDDSKDGYQITIDAYQIF